MTPTTADPADPNAGTPDFNNGANQGPATGNVELTGESNVGATVTATVTDLKDPDGVPAEPEFEYQWFQVQDGAEAPIEGAQRSTYQLATEDQGKKVKAEVTFTDNAENLEKLSSGTFPEGRLRQDCTNNTVRLVRDQKSNWKGLGDDLYDPDHDDT